MAQFLTTRWSIVARAADLDDNGQRALSSLCEAYWPPLFTYALRRGVSREEAKDVTQDFFYDLLEKGWLDRASMDRGKFRSFLLTAFKRHIIDHWRKQQALKRAGTMALFVINEKRLDEEDEQVSELVSAAMSPEEAYDLRWALTVLSRAMEKLRKEITATGRAAWFEQMQPFLAQGAESGDYSERAAALGISPNAFAQAVRRLRLSYRQAVRDEIAETVCHEDQVEVEMATLVEILRKRSS